MRTTGHHGPDAACSTKKQRTRVPYCAGLMRALHVQPRAADGHSSNLTLMASFLDFTTFSIRPRTQS